VKESEGCRKESKECKSVEERMGSKGVEQRPFMASFTGRGSGERNKDERLDFLITEGGARPNARGP
jgi:hypothetical protein